MNDLELIKVERVIKKGKKTLNIYNPTPYKLIGHGVRGAVFQIDEIRCVKVSANPKDSIREAEALEIAKNLPFIPKVFEIGANYIIMEFFKGIDLRSYIKKKKMLPIDFSRQIVECITAMREIGFTKIKLKLSQIIVTEEDELKFVDHSGVFTAHKPYPLELFNQLKNEKLLHVFLEHVRKLNPDMYSEWKENVDFSKKTIELLKKEGDKKEDFKSISVSRVMDSDGRKKLIINNPTNYRLIGKGVQGAVFQLDDDRCVKIYVKKSFVDEEMKAYAVAKKLAFVPKFYEHGSNYIIMEYIKGPSLYNYLQKLTLNKSLTQQILMIHRELKKIGFTRIESKLGHFIVTEGEVLKFVDHSDAFSYVQLYPNELFTDLKKLGLLHSFLEHAKELDPEQYNEWEKAVDLKKLVN